MRTKRLPETLLEATRYFDDEAVCVDFVAQLRWPDGPVCPTCGGTEHSYLTTRRVWKCKACKRQFSVKVGSIFEDSPISLGDWLCSIWLIANSKNGISSHELGRAVGLTQKSAWFVLHRIRLAMRVGHFDRFDGEIESDETYVGGRAANMHKYDRARKGTGHGYTDKTMVVGSLQRAATDDDVSQVHAEVMLDPEWDSPRAYVRRTVEPGANLYTDAAGLYTPLRGEYKHETVNHKIDEYARGRVTTNGLENFWTLVKRGLHGTYVSAKPEHLFRYIDERVFTFNRRDLTDRGRLEAVLSAVAGRRITYAELIGNA